MTEIKNGIIRFMFAGNSIFTIMKGNEHHSYKIYRKKTDDGVKIYHLYLRKANKGTYSGYFKIENNKLTFKRSYKYRCDHADEDIEILLDVVHNRNNLPEDISVYHSGRCGCCGRVLTDPEAISRGFGPECWKKIKDHV